MNLQAKELYEALPVFIQNVALTGFSALLHRERYRGDFGRYRKFLDESQWYPREVLESYQARQLREIIAYSYEHVPYYRNIMDHRGLKPKDIESQEDLQKLPILTRNDIKQNFSDLLSKEFKMATVKKGHTSGTTGSPLETCYSDNLVFINYALLDRQYAWADVRLKPFGDRVAVFRGNPIVPLNQKKPPFWRLNFLHNQLLFSSFHMNQENLPIYIDRLEAFAPRILDGYPSTAYVLAKYLKNQGRRLKLHAVITSSETLYDFQREVIEESFECRVFDYFAAAERVLFSTECDRHEGHHEAMEYGITEILDADHRAVDPGQEGLLVATSLHNRAMPMIRYATNDRSAIKERDCSCGRSLRLVDDVTTKAEDILTLSDGRLISPSVLTHPFKPLTSIIESQIVQDEIDRIVIKLVTHSEFSQKDESELIEGFRERLGEDVRIEIEKVDSIERTQAGKFKWVVSRVKLGI